ncbi:thioredoxin (macronuclear) [Tetrahymena thermophila SB210]|uniref:Thioredoxin n=1 Tax=Tetrahymena thermophila (strain SB210) TaxID=312017 RepID=A4VCW2_TETTS|nr:thioredoxin [Tetrahymena thermophila SB210]EDK31354.1 thioredoxin [Tetrahymena thermophila SB210]|eukprot:XP_001471027.1 thioredoxin [Tetrahymena thermophila SB210]
MKINFIFALVIAFAVVAYADHSFIGTIVEQYDQVDFAQKTGIGLGKKKMKEDFFVMFYAGWCPHCQRFMPVWIELKKDNMQDNFIAVHCPDNHDLCEAFGVQGYPTLLLFNSKEYKYCQFSDKRDKETTLQFWKKKCEGAAMKEINFRVDTDFESEDEDEENEDEIQEASDLDGSKTIVNKNKNKTEDPNLDEDEKKKDVKNFRVQKNKAYQDKIMKFKDYFKKLGPLTVVMLIGLCILSVTFVCNKCCSYDQEDPFTKTVLKGADKKSKSGYQKQSNNSSYVL